MIPTLQKVSALSLYRGHFYEYPGLKARIADEIENGRYQFLIMSAGYGFVHPFQRIHDYEQQMNGKVTTFWLRNGLPRVLEEYIREYEFKYAYGIFSKYADYRKIFEKVDWRTLKSIKEAGYFYLDDIRGASKVLQKQAQLLVCLLEQGFQKKPNILNEARVRYVKMIVCV